MALAAPVSAQKIKYNSAPKGADALATVDGQAITRRELTYYLLEVDRSLSPKLGALLTRRWKADRGQSPRYALSEAEIYREIYDKKSDYSATLDSLITTRLVAKEAKRQGILVTAAQMQAQAHALFDAFRKQNGLKLSDEEVMAKFQVPRDVFLQDMAYRVQSEALLMRDFTRRNGHAVRADDWIEVRALFAQAEDLGDKAETEKQFAAAKTRILAWQAEISAGKPFAEVAKARNQDATTESGGLHGLALRGTGTPDNVLFALPPGQMSQPVRVKTGWYVFTAARRGAEIPELERRAAWQAIAAATLPALLASLRHNAKIRVRY